MTRAEMIAEIEFVLVDNARLLGQPQDVFLRLRPDGSVRVQCKSDGRWVRGAYKQYPTIESALGAARVAHKRAQALRGAA